MKNMFWNNKIKYLFYIFTIYVVNNNKIYFPNNVFKFKNFHTDHNNLKITTIENILTAYSLYYNLYKKNISVNDIMNICEYIHIYYPYYNIHEKALIVGIYKLIYYKEFTSMYQLQIMLYNSFPESKYIYLGFLIEVYNKLLNLSDDTSKNMSIFYEIENILKNKILSKYEYKFIKVYYLHQYFLCEYFFYLAVFNINNNQLINGLLYLQKIIIRYNTHPICALEALFLMLNIFILLDMKPLVKKYFNLILNIYNRNKNINQDYMKNYLLKVLNLLHNYNLLEY